MAAQLADLPLKYRNGGRFDESNIRPGKDFFVFGQKEIDPENNDEGAAPPHRKRTSPSVMLRQKAAALRKAADDRARKKPLKKDLGKPGQRDKAAKHGKKPKTVLPPPDASAAAMALPPPAAAVAACPPPAAAAMDSLSKGKANCTDDSDLGTFGDPANEVDMPEYDLHRPASPVTGSGVLAGGVSGSGPHESADAESGDAQLGGLDAGSVGGRLGAGSTRASCLGAQAGGAGQPGLPREEPFGSKEHQSYEQVREWLDSPAVKDARKQMREKAKATKKASKIAVTGACSQRSDAAASEEEKNSTGSDSDEGDVEWLPSKVTHTGKDYIQITRLAGCDAIRVYRKGESGVALYYVLDCVSGEPQLVQIQSVWYDNKTKNWQMKSSRVYSTEMAIMVAEQEEDKMVVLKGNGQADRVVCQRGRIYLRDLLNTTKNLHHIGDVRNTSSPLYIIGIAAMLPASALIPREASVLQGSKDALSRTLNSAYNVNIDEARRMSADPIYIGEYFSEARPLVFDEETSDSSDVLSEKEPQSTANGGCAVQRPSRAPLRQLRARVASGQHPGITGDLDGADDDAPLFPTAGARPSNQQSDDSADSDASLSVAGVGAAKVGRRRDGESQKRGKAAAGMSAVARGQGGARAAGQKQKRDGPGPESGGGARAAGRGCGSGGPRRGGAKGAERKGRGCPQSSDSSEIDTPLPERKAALADVVVAKVGRGRRGALPERGEAAAGMGAVNAANVAVGGAGLGRDGPGPGASGGAVERGRGSRPKRGGAKGVERKGRGGPPEDSSDSDRPLAGRGRAGAGAGIASAEAGRSTGAAGGAGAAAGTRPGNVATRAGRGGRSAVGSRSSPT